MAEETYSEHTARRRTASIMWTIRAKHQQLTAKFMQVPNTNAAHTAHQTLPLDVIDGLARRRFVPVSHLGQHEACTCAAAIAGCCHTCSMQGLWVLVRLECYIVTRHFCV